MERLLAHHQRRAPLRAGLAGDCFCEGPSLLVIHPEECIDCGAREPACPTKAIFEVKGV